MFVSTKQFGYLCIIFSQIKQILSSEPRANHLPSGENFKEVTTPLCLDMEQSGRRKDLSGNDSSSLVEVESFGLVGLIGHFIKHINCS